MEVRVGCCGLAGMSLSKYIEQFDTIEINSTFYRLPSRETAERWFRTAGKNFTFCMKAFQGITHPITSSTWKKAGKQRPAENVENYGHLKPTKENIESWNKTLEICQALHVSICVIQLPPSFICTDGNVSNALKFFKKINRPVDVAIEFRHRSWIEKLEDTKNLINKARLIHITDPLKEKPLNIGSNYYRLHGLEKMYKYNYTDDDLRKLKKSIFDIKSKIAYVMFNNLSMREDALKFKKILQ